MPRILYLHPSLMPPPKNEAVDRFQLLSSVLGGHIVQAVWLANPAAVEQDFGPGAYPVLQRGNFRYHFYCAGLDSGISARYRIFKFFISKCLKICKKDKIDVIVAYSHMANGLLGVVLKWLTGIPLIIEIVTAPHLIAYAESPRRDWRSHLRRMYSDIALHLSVACCDRVHLLYPGQLATFPLLRRKRQAVFPEFVSISHVPERLSTTGPVIIYLLGAPWFLKGVDVLLAAFRRLAEAFPDAHLQIQGHFGSDDALLELARDCPRTEILKAVPNSEALERMRRASIFVLPSRCEGLPRVIIEAMACGLPVIGSDAGGIPHLVRDGENGFVVPVGDVAAFEQALRRLLADPELRERMGATSRRLALAALTEDQYRDCFRQMIERTMAHRQASGDQ